MPELPNPPKRVPPVRGEMPLLPSSLSYAELHCRTNFSFLEGASHADELVARSAELGHFALAVTDRNSVAGIVRAHVAAKEAGLKLVIGAEITPVNAAPGCCSGPWTGRGYGRLARLVTRGRRAAPKGNAGARFDDVADLADGLLAGVLLSHSATAMTCCAIAMSSPTAVTRWRNCTAARRIGGCLEQIRGDGRQSRVCR